MFISPDTVSGIGVSLQMVFAAVVGGLYVPLGPTVGAAITIVLTETFRIRRSRPGQFGLRHAAGIIHHLSAAGPARFGAGHADPEGGRST
jgi:ABC-type branched-subunit amino acid transport system permease subunit